MSSRQQQALSFAPPEPARLPSLQEWQVREVVCRLAAAGLVVAERSWVVEDYGLGPDDVVARIMPR